MNGVWIVYDHCDLRVRAVFDDELDARRWKDENYDFDRVKFIGFGEEIK